MLSKERGIFLKIYNKSLDKIDELSKTIGYGDLRFIVNSSVLKIICSESKNSIALLDSIEKREISIEEARYK